jgi:NADH-quinone oxidoreductase subunit N
VVFSLLLISSIHNKQQKHIINWTSLSDRCFIAAATFGLSILSIAGIPPLAGFFSKLCVISALILKEYLLVVFTVVVFSSIACFYYIKLVKILLFSANVQGQHWFSHGTRNVELFISVGLVAVTLFLTRSDLLIDCSVVISLLIGN